MNQSNKQIKDSIQTFFRAKDYFLFLFCWRRTLILLYFYINKRILEAVQYNFLKTVRPQFQKKKLEHISHVLSHTDPTIQSETLYGRKQNAITPLRSVFNISR